MTTLHTIARSLTMAEQIEQIKQSELTASEREVLDRDRERWRRVGGGGHLDEWLEFYPGLEIRRRLAMRLAYTNKPEGKGYALALSQLYADDGFDVRDKSMMTAFTAVLWLGDDPERMTILREIRNAMTPGERSRLNSPISARQRVEKVLKARARGTEEKLKESPVVSLKRRIADLERELAATKNKTDGSLFDFAHDSGADIGKVIVSNVGRDKARTIASTILAGLKAKSKPAG